MESPLFPMPGYRVNDYLLVLNPPEELAHKIIRAKEEFARQFKMSAQRSMRPHIALVSFTGWEMMEDKLVQRLQAIAMGTTPFKVELRDYGSYPTHSIFINVVSRLPIQGLVKSLKDAQRLMKSGGEVKPYFMEEPHIPIGRRLKPWQYEQGWQSFSHRQFTGRFIADSMLLLRRKSGDKGAFQIARKLDFMNLPVTTKQGSLFT